MDQSTILGARFPMRLGDHSPELRHEPSGRGACSPRRREHRAPLLATRPSRLIRSKDRLERRCPAGLHPSFRLASPSARILRCHALRLRPWDSCWCSPFELYRSWPSKQPCERGVTLVRDIPLRRDDRNGQTPPGESKSPYDFGNGGLWTLLPIDGKLAVSMTRLAPPGTVFGELRGDGSIATKFRGGGQSPRDDTFGSSAGGLDRHAKPLRASVAPGLTRARHFWATRIIFTTQGCRQVTGTAGTQTLTFVVQVMTG